MRLPHTLALHRSRHLVFLLLAVHAGALAAALLADLIPVLRSIVAVAITASAWLALRRNSGRVCALTLGSDGTLEVEHADGQRGRARVLAQSTVIAWVVVLLLRGEGWRESLTILPDSLSPDDFRALRLWLRWRAKLD